MIAAQPRQVVLRVKMTEPQLATMDRAAEALGITRSLLVRKAVAAYIIDTDRQMRLPH
jgi:hypothetical protein